MPTRHSLSMRTAHGNVASREQFKLACASERNIKVTSGRQRPLYGTAFLNSQLPSNLNRKNVTEIKVGLLVVCFKDYFLRLLCWCARTAPPYICVCLRPSPMYACVYYDGPVCPL